MTAAPNTVRYFALIPAAGVGARMEAGSPKQYLPIAGKPMLRHALDAFLASPLIAHTYVVVSAEDGLIGTVVPEQGVTVLRCGGATRMETILNALQALHSSIGAHDQGLVHDAARPGLTPALIAKLIVEVGEHAAGGLLALPVVDTVKRAGPGAGANNVSAQTVPRGAYRGRASNRLASAARTVFSTRGKWSI